MASDGGAPMRVSGSASPPATVPPFDQVGVAVVPGEDLVVRLPGVLLVVAVDAAEVSAPSPARGLRGWEAAGQVQGPALAVPVASVWAGELIDLCRAMSAAGRRSPGRRLLESLRAWLPTVSERPSFAAVAATEEGLVVALAGRGRAEIPDLGLRLTAEPVSDGTPLLDRMVDWPPAALWLSAGSAAGGAPHPLSDLQVGVVPGSAAVLAPAPGPNPVPDDPGSTTVRPSPPPPPPGSSGRPPMPEEPGPSAPADPPGGDGAGHGSAGGRGETRDAAPASEELPPPARSDSLQPPPDDEPPREPLPVPSGRPVAELPDGRPMVKGFLCSRGHLNDPRVHFCALCGIRMAERTGVFTEGLRPPLGLLVFDDGVTVTLDADYLLGREPEDDPRVRTSELRPLLVADRPDGVSRRHAEIRLEGWDVVLVDIGSANGTLVAPPGAGGWSSLVPGQPVRLSPGTSVRMGHRQFLFDSPHGRS